jgi:glycosyltransferase involved in cell wall biosynthesis
MISSRHRGGSRGILFFGAYDPRYPRNAIIRRGWSALGFPVAECRAGEKRKVHTRYPILLVRYARMRDRSPILFVPEFRHKDVPLAWVIARCSGRRLVFDPLVSRYETRVLDRGSSVPGSAQSRHNRNLDAVSLRLADLVLADTHAHARFYAKEFGTSPDKIRVLPVGFDESLFRESPLPAERSVLEVLFYGTYLPLHGVETIVEAASLLRGAPVHFTLVGAGQTFPAVQRRASLLPEGLVDLRGPTPVEELPAVIAASDVVLGVFGTTPKAGMVVPNKLFQALAVGRPVVTADTAAARELFRDGEHMLMVPAGDAPALAGAISRLRSDAQLRRALAGAGGSYARAEFNSTRIAEKLTVIFEEAGFW